MPTRGRVGVSVGESRIMQLASQSGAPNPETDMRSKLERAVEWINQGENPYLGYQDENAVLKVSNASATVFHSVLQRVKEHCLMGLRGLVRRSLDGHFVHANIDTDVIIADAQQGRD